MGGRESEGTKMPKRRGRPPKTKRLHEELKITSVDGGSTNSSSSWEDEHEPMASKPRTRYALPVSDKKATPNSQSRIPPQSMDEHSSETLMLVKQILFEPSRADNAVSVQADSKDTHTDLESTSPAKIIEAQKEMNQTPPMKNGLDVEKFASDLLSQTPNPELPFKVASPSEKALTNYIPPQMEPSAVSNVSPSLSVRTSESPAAINAVMSMPEDPTVEEVEGYRVRKEVVPLLKAIFKKYGDIARKSLFSMESRSCLLELVCTIYKRLEASDFMQLTQLELDSMEGQIKDLELVKVNIGWLHKRLNLISKAMEVDLKGRGAIEAVIDEKKIAVKKHEEELQKLGAKLQQEKDELDALQVCTGSLVHGLV